MNHLGIEGGFMVVLYKKKKKKKVGKKKKIEKKGLCGLQLRVFLF